jgi:hypothetical protein
LSWPDQYDQGSATAVNELVDLRRQAATRAADAVIERLVVEAEDDPDGRLSGALT